MKKIKFKPIIVSILLIIFQSILYALSKVFCITPHLIGGSIDDKIPFTLVFIIPYVFWYLMLFIIPYMMYKKDKTNFYKYIITNVITVVIANIIFVIYPTIVNRPELVGNDVLTLMTRFIYWIDTPALNCFPSLHCGFSMLFILHICTSKKQSLSFRVFTLVMSVLVMASTLLIKQHVFIDLIAGDILATIVYLIIRNEMKFTNKVKQLVK
jgi:membrane-associated phospholipid phosphatase